VNLVSVGIARAVRIAGVLLMMGLGVDAISLAWERPLAFLLFAVIGCSLTLIGILVYLYSLVAVNCGARSLSERPGSTGPPV
jgi:hypothetical protein